MFFTYTDVLDPESLQQGDVVERTPAIEAILQEAHPYYLNTDYRYFIVLTQSCDLVRRTGNTCKAPYITIAAVRPLVRAVERYASRLLRNEIERQFKFASDDRKSRLRQFVERVLNNNEPEYFFLHAASGTSMIEDHVAFLQLSIALKSHLHYDTILSAKFLQLTESFQHKLGYLVGTSYSRVGTDDWVPRYVDQDKFEQVVSDHVGSVGITWLERRTYERASKLLREIDEPERTADAFERTLRQARRSREQRKQEVLAGR